MKAFLLRAPAPVTSRPLELTDLEIPSPGPDDVLVRVRACGICRTDLHVVEGELPPRLDHIIPGHQIVGDVVELGSNVSDLEVGRRIGVAWLNHTCGVCRFCVTVRENLCEYAEFTGWTVNGGFAEYMVVPAAFAYEIPNAVDDIQAAPLLCAGIIGFRALRLTGLSEKEWAGARLGIYGFGAAGHVAIQLARARGAEVYVSTRDRVRHQSLATELGAKWVGGSTDEPPVKLNAAIIFAPAGELIPIALKSMDKGGVLVLGGIHMSPIPSFDYALIYDERVLRSVANNTREDGRDFLAEATRVPVRTHVQVFPFDQANDALIALKEDAIRGAGVLEVWRP